MRRLLLALLPFSAGLLLLIASLWLAADAESARSTLGKSYSWLFVVVAAAGFVLVSAVVREAWILFRQWRLKRPGSRLNLRFALLICALAIPPTLLVSAFAVRFVDAGIDSWFRADVASSQANAEALGREVLASFERRSRDLGNVIADHPALRLGSDTQTAVDQIIEGIDTPAYLSLYDQAGTLEAIGFNTSAVVLPPAPSEAEVLQMRSTGQVAVTERIGETLVWRVLNRTSSGGLLQTIVPVSADIAPRLDALERTAIDYAQLRFQRQAMKSTLILILGLVSMLALLGALYAAFYSARRLIQPITDLALATAEIAQGRYGRTLTAHNNDDIGFLTQGFNRMSTELLAADQRERTSRAEIEQNRAHLHAVLERLSAGVISFSPSRVLTANPAAYALLDIADDGLEGCSLPNAIMQYPRAAPLFELFVNCADTGQALWREEVLLHGEPSRALMVRGTRLGSSEEPRFVAVFDDAAVIANSQREAAWAEVAKRLAHEIKNPLTPIQLAAERLRRKYLGKMEAADADVLDRATSTIVSQVDALKRIVNAFGDYTRPAIGDRQHFDLRELVEEVAQLYEHSGQCVFRKDLGEKPAPINGRRERMRQGIINVITNAIEASEPAARASIEIELKHDGNMFHLSFRDHGGGLPDEFDARWFEPYNTTKPKGSGLGLATLKKVTEEHFGTISAFNAQSGGACFVMTLPAASSNSNGMR